MKFHTENKSNFINKSADYDYLYQPHFIPLVIPLIQKWYHEQFPDKDNMKVNTISKKIIECFV